MNYNNNYKMNHNNPKINQHNNQKINYNNNQKIDSINQKNDLIKIDDIYEHVINNKIFVDLPVSDFDQNNNIRISNKNREDNNYITDLINNFKSNNINFKNNNTNTNSNINVNNSQNNSNEVITNLNSIGKIKNSFLYFISDYINDDISNIKINIKKHIDDEDFEPIKNISNSYKKGIQAIKVFLIEDNTDLELN
jgi:hypothetical protein